MYEHPATQANIRVLLERGCHFVGPESGRLACGTYGIGKLIDPNKIVDAALSLLDPRNDYQDIHVLITNGPTREPIDPVRFISNRSSGKMGSALAREALARKAKVTVVSGPVEEPLPFGAEVIPIETAEEMARAVEEYFPKCDVFLAAAAVADYRVEEQWTIKQKKTGGPLPLKLVENPDVLGNVAKIKSASQVVVGFAAETHEIVENARKKALSKGTDFILANVVGIANSGFGAPTSQAYWLDAEGNVEELGMLEKSEIAQHIFDRVRSFMNEKS